MDQKTEHITNVQRRGGTHSPEEEKKRASYLAYYHAHKEHIRQYRKESGLAKRSYDKYYEQKKEIIRQKNLARYHAKKKAESSDSDEPEKPPADSEIQG